VLVVPDGALTPLPFHLLVTEKPAAAIPQLKNIGSYRDAAWLIMRLAVGVLPALASLKALRQAARRDPVASPWWGSAIRCSIRRSGRWRWPNAAVRPASL
jgi:hypothetical protein